ncbi:MULTISPECIES: SMI1/KNR4 family protein [Pseudomonas syringae group]|uniref:SMI1/KNR4 family protein n=1 Tax=Pseudomonas cannabina pv. alisalensis TaxID=757414 RepID=A0ABS1XL02_PSEC1|nr:SMI1/KNR4 family protein [Pseudomonas coronafaciens]MBM0142173.1 SMI1/KNR4 family protein [Pseudomonas cannabina pv. alisalensis]
MDIDLNSAIAELKSSRIPLPRPQQLPDDELLNTYEQELGVSFPSAYRTFAKEASDSICNGKDALRLTASRDSPRELLDTVIEARQQGLPKSWIPICEDNGNYYCILEDGTVRYWSHDGSSNESWPNLASWIKQAWIDGE